MKSIPIFVGCGLSTFATLANAGIISFQNSTLLGPFYIQVKAVPKEPFTVPRGPETNRKYLSELPIPESGAASDWTVNGVGVTDDLLKALLWTYDNGTISTRNLDPSDSARLGFNGTYNAPVIDHHNVTDAKFDVDQFGHLKWREDPSPDTSSFIACYSGNAQLLYASDGQNSNTSNCVNVYIQAHALRRPGGPGIEFPPGGLLEGISHDQQPPIANGTDSEEAVKTAVWSTTTSSPSAVVKV